MKLLKLLLVAALLCSYSALQCQTNTFKTFNSEDGVTPFVYNIIQDDNGFLLIGTGDGLLKYDGLDFHLIDENNGLGGSIVSCSYKDVNGTIWLGHSKSGKISILKDNTIDVLDISEFTKNKVNAITQDASGNIWIASQNEGLICYSKDGQIKNFKEELDGYMLLSIQNLGGNHIALGTNEGVFVVSNTDSSPSFQFLDEGPYTKVYNFEKVNSKFLVATEDDGLYSMVFHQGKFQIEQIIDDYGLAKTKINDLHFAKDKLYLTSSDKILEIDIESEGSVIINSVSNLNEGNVIGSTNLRSVFVDRENDLWVASFGDGLFKRNASYFITYDLPETKEVYGVSVYDDLMMSCTKGELVSFPIEEGMKGARIMNHEQGIPNDSILCVSKDFEGNSWLGTKSHGLYLKPKEKDTFESFFLANDINAKKINCIESTDLKVYVGTSDGLFIIDKETRTFERLGSQDFNHNVINNLFKDKSGRIWLSLLGKELVYFENDELKFKKISDGNGVQIETVGITEDLEGNLWIATGTQGVVKIGEENIQFTKNLGLLSSSTYGIICDKNGKIWVTHRDGLSKIDPNNDIVTIYNSEKGITQDFSNAIAEDSDQNLWFGSNDGIVKYYPDLDMENQVEPSVVFTKIMVSDSLSSEASVASMDYGQHKIEIDFTGVSLRNTENVHYKYYLEGYDEGWGEYTNQTKVSFKPSPGEYTFKVKAFNADGVGGETVSELKFSIDNPFWLKPWFIVTMLIFTLGTVRFFIYWREKQLKERQEYLERELEARTEEVVNKNTLLEEKNKDITDSINYAKHIQSALIPSDEELKHSLPESFVFFRPRDIVSGDFYWVKEFGDTVIVVGADCTGHGVPGAFISLIGMSVLKEISNREDINDPAKALNHLEIEIENTLNKNKEYGVKDGMDLGIIEFNKKTRNMRYAGARRPLLIFRGNEHFILNGDRQSIGGSYEDEPLKQFSIQEFQLEKNDRMYLWSDGYPDQFGGPRAKKLKQKGLLDILSLIHI